MGDFIVSSANFVDTYVGALATDFDAIYTFMKPFLNIAEGASKLLGMFA
ncbi:hypothetical protein J8244_11525 [Corynebacterium tuberculostearicum]|nr:hypothetical protein [Corynebacterium tuberculostearicum]WKE50720.1 hypothetical protein J8244_11525 [Corynebacterium tuberculostearicum]